MSISTIFIIYIITTAVFVLIKCVGSINESNKYKKYIHDRTYKINYVTNQSVESDVFDYILKRKNNEEIMLSIKEDLEFVFGDSYYAEFRLPDISSAGDSELPKHLRPTFWAGALLLSKDGYLPRTNAMYGFCTSNFNEHEYQWNKRMLMRIEYNMKKSGKDVMFYKESYSNDNYPEFSKIGGDFFIKEHFYDMNTARREW